MRGMAILAIVLHNYCHWLRGSVQENEYTFSAVNNERLLNALLHPDWSLPVQLLSYFGHYGVPVFLFLSGFGLVMKYSQEVKALPFIRYNYLKLFRMMIIGFVFFLIVDRLTPGAHHYDLPDIVSQLLMFNNLLPQPDKVIWPGPFWFFGLMMQLYIIYRLFIHRRHWGFVAALVVLSLVVQLPFLHDADTLNRLRYNCISGMLPFGIGVAAGRLSPRLMQLTWQRWQWTVVLLTSAVLTLLLCLWAPTWLLASAGVIGVMVALVKLLPSTVLNWLTWTGGISAAMFVAHPTLRKIFIPISHQGDVYAGLLIYLMATFVVSWLFMMIINKMSKPKL